MASHSDFILSYGPISGNDQQNIVNLEGDGYIYNVRISDDGSTLYYITTAHENPAKNGLYLYDLTTGENSIIAPGATWSFDVTQDGNKVLYEYSEPGVDSDSYVYDRTTEEETQLTRGSSETFFLQFSNDGATVFFISLRDAKSNIYSIPSAGGSESQITQTGDVAAIQLGNSDVYMFYYTIEALFVTAVDTTGEAREVSNNVLTPLVPEFPGNF
jgi:Tol biopolymer transport system component